MLNIKKLLLLILVVTWANSNAQTSTIGKYAQTVPKGKKWVIPTNKKILINFEVGSLQSGTYCNAILNSNEPYLMSVLETYSGYGVQTKNAYNIKIASIKKTIGQATLYEVIPSGYDQIMTDGRSTLNGSVKNKSLVFYEGQIVRLNSCIVELQVLELPLSNADRKRISEEKRRRELALKKEEDNRLAEERKRKIEAEKRQRESEQKLALRIKNESFPYDSIAPESYNEAIYQLDKRLKGICHKYDTQYLDIDFEVLISIDSLGDTSVKKLKGLTDTSEVNKEIQEFITSFSLPPAEIKGSKCNSQFKYQFAHKSVYNEYDFDLLYNQKGISAEVRTREDDFIKKYLETNDLPYGKYNLKMKSLTVNGREEKSLSVNAYKSFAGSGAFIPSLFIPGLGNRMVSGKGRSGTGITAICYSLVGTGVLAKLESNRQYNLYENETDPLKKFDYGENAKYWKNTSYWLMGTGSVIWLYNTYRVFKLGKRNQENKKLMEQRLNPTIGYAPRNGLQFGLTYKF